MSNYWKEADWKDQYLLELAEEINEAENLQQIKGIIISLICHIDNELVKEN